MGFLDFLFKPKVELPKQEPLWESSEPVWERPKVTLEKTRQYSDKGVGICKSKKNPWRAYLAFSVRDTKGNKTKTYTYHIGQYSTKEEAQKARWEFIENLK